MSKRRLLFQRHTRALARRAREIRMIALGLTDTNHPVLAHLIPIRRCNLDCGYCNEYDDFSKPVAIETLKHRVDLLANLGTTVVTLSGCEPLLHPEVDDLIAPCAQPRRIRWRSP